MNEVEMWFLALGAAAGATLAVLFFGGLWWTVRDIAERERPAVWMVTSFVLRTAIVLVGFYLVGQLGWESLAVAAASFVATRFAVTGVLGPSRSTDVDGQGEASWS